HTVVIVIIVLIGLRFALLRLDSAFAKSAAETAESLALAMGLVFLVIRPFFVQAFYIPTQSMEPTLMGHNYGYERIHDHILVNKSVYRIREPRHGDIVVFKAPPEALGISADLSSDEMPKQMDYIKRVVAVEGDKLYIKPGYLIVDGDMYDRVRLIQQVAQYESIPPEKIRIRYKSDGVYINGLRATDEQLANYMGRVNPKIEVNPGYVVRNGVKLDEPYIAEDPDLPYPWNGTIDFFDSDRGNMVKEFFQDAINDGKLHLKQDKDGQEYVEVGKDYVFVMGDNRNHSSDSRFWGPVHEDRIQGRALFVFWPINRIHWVR
ncbi:MAG TPA: signal peptidase I, partial [Armatimonadota bacterium]|nr:signal peptidase I [Armatimonadota bacterium]